MRILLTSKTMGELLQGSNTVSKLLGNYAFQKENGNILSNEKSFDV